MTTRVALVTISLFAAACGSKSRDKEPPAAGKPAEPPAAAKPAEPPPAAAVKPADPAPPPAAAGAITFGQQPDDASCVAYLPQRNGEPLELPTDVAKALECPISPPEALPTNDGFVYVAANELRFWKIGADPSRRLVLFDVPKDGELEGLSYAFSPDGTKLAAIAKVASYPQGTRLFVLTVSPAGEVTGKFKQDAAVFSPCGSVCTPQAPVWKDAKTIEITPPTDDGGPGSPVAIKL